MKKLYGEDVHIVDTIDELPEGWILVDDTRSSEGTTDN